MNTAYCIYWVNTTRHMVYYRKYRPQTVNELDLSEVRNKLTSILKAKELPHAFLFTGPKGLGKTSAARILAKAINCERVSRVSKVSKGEKARGTPDTLQIEPCNKCGNCVSITNGSNIDVLEIDAASNRGIDEIRDLREKIKFSPAYLPRKVYIIDEVHMLTADAFNALLKTLEEPPAHAVFILCTTEVEKVPATIISRTFHVEFRRPTKEEIIRSIARIVKGEKLNIEDEVLDEIYKLSENSFRDAAKILEELAISSKGKITIEILEASFRTAGMDPEIKNLLSCLAAKDIKMSLKIIDDFANKGTDFKILTEKLAEAIHAILMLRAQVSSEAFDIESFTTSDLQTLLTMVNDSYRDIKLSVLPQIPLELVVVEWCLQPEAEIKNEKLKVKNEGAESSSQVEEKTKSDSGQGMFADNAISENFMAALLTAVKQDNHSIAGILRGCRLVEIAGDTVRFETKYKFHKDKLSEAKASSILDNRASEILKENVHVVVNLVGK